MSAPSEQRLIVESYLREHFPEHRVRAVYDGRAWQYTLVGDPDYSVQVRGRVPEGALAGRGTDLPRAVARG